MHDNELHDFNPASLSNHIVTALIRASLLLKIRSKSKFFTGSVSYPFHLDLTAAWHAS